MKPTKSILIALLIVITLMAIFYFYMSLTNASESQSTEDTQIMQTIQDSMPNVVYLGDGSGFYLNPTQVLTNWHVIKHRVQGTRIMVTNAQGDTVEGKVIRYSAFIDYALIETPYNSAVRSLQTAEVRVGQTILHLGAPDNLSFTATKGMVSHLNRLVKMETTMKLHQIDGSVNGGQSGSMVLTTDGFLVGVMVLKSSGAEGIGYMIPIEQIKED